MHSLHLQHDVQLAQFLLPNVVRIVILQNDQTANEEVRMVLSRGKAIGFTGAKLALSLVSTTVTCNPGV